MPYKHLLYVVVILLISTLNAYPQEESITPKKHRIYVNFGKSFSAASNTFWEERQYFNGESDWETKHFSYGSGFNLGLSYAYRFNENLSANIGFSYLFGSKLPLKYRFADTTYMQYVNQEVSLSANMFRVNPSFTIELGKGKIRPYGRMGMLFNMGKIKRKVTEKWESGGTWFIEEEIRGGVSIGPTAAMGIDIRTKYNTHLFVEVEYIGVNHYFKEWELTKMVDQTGFNGLNNLSTSQKEGYYVDNIDGSAPQSPDEPTPTLQVKSAFSSIGINAGLIFEF